MSFDPDTLEPRTPKSAKPEVRTKPETTADTAEQAANDAPLALEKNPIPWPKKDTNEPARAGEVNRPAPASVPTVVADTDTATEQEELHGPEYVREL